MKKFYGSVAIISVIIAHSAVRFLMADSYTFSEADYLNTETEFTSVVTSVPTAQNVSFSENQFGIGYNTTLLSNARFITNSGRGLHSFNQ